MTSLELIPPRIPARTSENPLTRILENVEVVYLCPCPGHSRPPADIDQWDPAVRLFRKPITWECGGIHMTLEGPNSVGELIVPEDGRTTLRGLDNSLFTETNERDEPTMLLHLSRRSDDAPPLSVTYEGVTYSAIALQMRSFHEGYERQELQMALTDETMKTIEEWQIGTRGISEAASRILSASKERWPNHVTADQEELEKILKKVKERISPPRMSGEDSVLGQSTTQYYDLPDFEVGVGYFSNEGSDAYYEGELLREIVEVSIGRKGQDGSLTSTTEVRIESRGELLLESSLELLGDNPDALVAGVQGLGKNTRRIVSDAIAQKTLAALKRSAGAERVPADRSLLYVQYMKREKEVKQRKERIEKPIEFVPLANDSQARIDAARFFKCAPEKIAGCAEDINASTSAYVGELFPGIFDQLPANVPIYTSFPDSQVRRHHVDIGKRSFHDFNGEFRDKGIKILDGVEELMEKHLPQSAPATIEAVALSLRDLGFTKASLAEIINRAQSLGLEICHPAVGPYLRLAYTNQLKGERLIVVADHREDRHTPYFFSLRGSSLCSEVGRLTRTYEEADWYINRFLFQVPSK